MLSDFNKSSRHLFKSLTLSASHAFLFCSVDFFIHLRATYFISSLCEHLKMQGIVAIKAAREHERGWQWFVFE
jgi:hypothetical protein